MRFPALSRSAKANPPLAWNDVEALPIYAALAMCAVFLWLIANEVTNALEISALKAVGVMGCLALRYAWLQLDEDVPPA